MVDGSVSAGNTSNTSVAISGVPYNKNVTFSVLAGNCIGESATALETVNIGSKLNLMVDSHISRSASAFI